ncbi:MAG: efflux RND transporter periplasmic adaptor subunit [Chloroflexi bacterium]|nr:efflux RND transporter periplasmic adaptor subunit [Chloroflexota bacterium]
MGKAASIFRTQRKLVLSVGTLALVIAILGASGSLWYENAYFISTENASVAGPMVKVFSPNAGRIAELRRDIGSAVNREDTLAVVDVPLATNLPLGGARANFLDDHTRLLPVITPINGIVVNRSVNVGDTVSTTQTLFTVVDTRNLWVIANVEETKVSRITPGQWVDIYVDALGQTVTGSVEEIIPATTSTFALIPSQNAAGNFTKVVQMVPVKIQFHGDGLPLIVGSSVKVRVHTGQ